MSRKVGKCIRDMVATRSFLDYNAALGACLNLDNLVLLAHTKKAVPFCPPVLVVGCTGFCCLTFELSLKLFRCPPTVLANKVLEHRQTSLRTGPLNGTLGRSASHAPCVVPGSIVQGYTQVTECHGWFIILGQDLGGRTASTERTLQLVGVEKMTGLGVSIPLLQALRVHSLLATRTPTGREE
jgi:hypothetical protein